MQSIAKQLVAQIEPELRKRAIVIAMEGPLGAGKTTLTKSLVQELGGQDRVSSPTFVLHIPHEIALSAKHEALRLEHIDAYRLDDYGELLQIGLQKMIENKSIIVIEWADKFEKEIKKLSNEGIKLVWVKIEYKSDLERNFIIS